MTNKEVYESIAEEGLLKSLGPFRLMVSDQSIFGIYRPHEDITKPLIIGEILTYGDGIVIEGE